jgi:hypothetical protein
MRGGLAGHGRGVGWEGQLLGRVHAHPQSWLVFVALLGSLKRRACGERSSSESELACSSPLGLLAPEVGRGAAWRL